MKLGPEIQVLMAVLDLHTSICSLEVADLHAKRIRIVVMTVQSGDLQPRLPAPGLNFIGKQNRRQQLQQF